MSSLINIILMPDVHVRFIVSDTHLLVVEPS
jgi:hypothetical protein